MTRNVLAPAADFLSCYPFQHQEHVRAWRYFMWRQGVDVRSNGRRFDLRGNPL